MIKRHPQPGLVPFLSRTVAAQTHLVALLIAIVGTFCLVAKCLRHYPINHVVATLIFGVTSIILFAISSLYHFLYDGFVMSDQLEAWFEKLDHIAIYLFISGTYTVVLLNSVSYRWANILLVVIWSFTFIGGIYTLTKHRLATWAQHRYAYTTLYVVMGLVFLLRLGEILNTLSKTSVLYLSFGAASYIVGAVIYAVRRPNLITGIFGFHELWHIFVFIGYLFHYQLIYGFY